MKKIKNGLILAGGDSTRFWPLKDKNFFTFLNKSLILIQVEKLSNYCDNIYIVANQNNITHIKRVLDNAQLKTKYEIIIQQDYSIGQAGAILSAIKFINGETIIINANDYLDFSVLEKIDLKDKDQGSVCLFGKKINYYFPGGYFKFDNKNQITAIIEKPGKDNLPSNYLKLFLDYYSDISIFYDYYKKKIKKPSDDVYEIILSEIVKNNKSYFYQYDNLWHSLKYPWHILKMMKIFLNNLKENQIAKSASISKNAIIIPPVYVDEYVKIGDFVKIVGPTYIGENTIIGDYSLIRESHINNDCLIGSYSEIARSYIGNKVFLHRNYIGDSVIDDQVMFGAQAVTGNLRFDGENIYSYINDEKINTNLEKLGVIIGANSKVGVNSTIFPGVKIGRNTWVAPNEKVRYDLEDNIYFINKKEKFNDYEIK